MKVTYQKQDYQSTGFQFYIHSLPNGGKFTLNQQIKKGTNTAGSLDANINDVYEVYYYKNSSNNGALKVKTSSDAKIFYKDNVTETGNWTEYTESTNPPPAFTNLFTTIKDEVEIKVEKKNGENYGFSQNQINVTNTGGTEVTGYKFYKHSRTQAFNIEKVRYNATEIRGFPLPISSVEEVNVYYEATDTNRDKPLLLYTKTSSSTYTYYGKGTKNFQMHWWKIEDLSGEPDAKKLEDPLEMLLNRLD